MIYDHLAYLHILLSSEKILAQPDQISDNKRTLQVTTKNVQWKTVKDDRVEMRNEAIHGEKKRVEEKIVQIRNESTET